MEQKGINCYRDYKKKFGKGQIEKIAWRYHKNQHNSTLCSLKTAKVKGFDLRRKPKSSMSQNSSSLGNFFLSSWFIEFINTGTQQPGGKYVYCSSWWHFLSSINMVLVLVHAEFKSCGVKKASTKKKASEARWCASRKAVCKVVSEKVGDPGTWNCQRNLQGESRAGTREKPWKLWQPEVRVPVLPQMTPSAEYGTVRLNVCLLDFGLVSPHSCLPSYFYLLKWEYLLFCHCMWKYLTFFSFNGAHS